MAQIDFSGRRRAPNEDDYVSPGEVAGPAATLDYGGLRGSIETAYQKYLGRTPGEGEYQFWVQPSPSGGWGYTSPTWEQNIAQSPEGQQYATRQPPTPPSNPFDLSAFERAYASLTQQPGRTGTVDEWINVVYPELARQFPGIGLTGSKRDKVTLPDDLGWFDAVLASGAGGQGYNPFSLQQNAGGGGGAPTTGYTDPSTSLYVNELVNRIGELRQPVTDPLGDLYALAALARFQDLQQPAYTSGEDAALRAKYQEPLTQARDAALTRQREDLGRYGYLPSSGLAVKQRGDIERGYQQGVAGISNDLAVRSIDETQRRKSEALLALLQLATRGDTLRDEDRQRAMDLVSTSQLLPQLDATRLDQLLRASDPTAASSALSSLFSLGGLFQNQQGVEDRNRQATSYAWGSLLPYLMAALFPQRTGG